MTHAGPSSHHDLDEELIKFTLEDESAGAPIDARVKRVLVYLVKLSGIQHQSVMSLRSITESIATQVTYLTQSNTNLSALVSKLDDAVKQAAENTGIRDLRELQRKLKEREKELAAIKAGSVNWKTWILRTISLLIFGLVFSLLGAGIRHWVWK